MPKTNTYKQPIDDKGRTLRTTEIYEAKLQGLLPELTRKQRKAIAQLMLEENYKDYAHDVNLGIDIGRREILTAILSAKDLKSLQAWAATEQQGSGNA